LISSNCFCLFCCHSFEYDTLNILSPVLSTRSSASKALNSMNHPLGPCSMRVILSPNIISGGVMPSFLVISSMGPALRIGSLRVVILKLPCTVEVSACPGATVSAGAPLSVAILFESRCDRLFATVMRIIMRPDQSAGQSSRSVARGGRTCGVRIGISKRRWLFPVATTLVWTRPYMDQTIPDLSSPGQTQDIDRPH
jgi:hypothetical protein